MKEKKTLYLGLDPSRYQTDYKLIHLPIIAIEPLALDDSEMVKAFKNASSWTHILLTSRIAARLFFQAASHFGASLADKEFLAIGKATASLIETALPSAKIRVASQECSEGLLELVDSMLEGYFGQKKELGRDAGTLIETLELQDAHIFYPHSERARRVLSEGIKKMGIELQSLPLYRTVYRQIEPIDLNDFTEIVFTSPSTVEAFLANFGYLPENVVLRAIGPITSRALLQKKRAATPDG